MRLRVLIFSTAATLFCASLCSAEPCALSLVSPAQSTLAHPVSVTFNVEGDQLVARFDVQSSQIFGKPVLGPGEYPYMFDAVEFFVSVETGELPYYEIELTPYRQTFEVKIIDLHHPFINGIDLGITNSVTRTAQGWVGQINLPLSKIGWDGNPEKITGNAYAILGTRPNRIYYSAFKLPASARPNFHQPSSFAKLLRCSEDSQPELQSTFSDPETVQESK